MNIIIPRITGKTNRKDLRGFVNRVLDSWFRLPFSAHPQIVRCRIISVTDRTGVNQRHGIINVTPDDAALRIIQKLNGKYLNEKRVGVKRYDLTIEKSLDRMA